MIHLNRWVPPVAVLAAFVTHVPGDDQPKSVQTVEAEVRFTDDSIVRMVVLQDKLEVQTRYGRLLIPTVEIQSIDFGVHLPEGQKEKVTEAIDQLGSDNYRMRETALKNLIEWGPLAFPQVEAAIKSDEPEIMRRAVMALDKIRAKYPARQLRLRQDDVISTTAFTIVGRITSPVMRARNVNFGELDLKLCTLRAVRCFNPGFETDITIDAAKYGSAQNLWMATGFEARAGTRLMIVANGMVDLWPQPGGGPMYHTNAKGFRSGGGVGQYLPGCLLGKIGEDGPILIIGDHYDEMTTRNGKLYLQIVPSPWGNNSAGCYQVKITPRNEFGGGD